MILLFPDVDTLRLVLTGGLLPAETIVSKARFSFDSAGKVAVETSAKLTKKTTTELDRLGVKSITSHPTEPRPVSCWPQILPVTRDPAVPQLSTQTPVLFELESAADLPTLVTEMLRLGNDRQTIRWLVDGTKKLTDRVLLRVLGPPYYTLLRALESSTSGTQGAVRAYLEQAPRVWVQISFSQPFADRLKPAEGQLVLIRPTREWEFLSDGPFHDVYELVQFELPTNPVAWNAATAYGKIEVPLRLVAGNAADTPEMWILRDDAINKLDAFVRDSDERISQRLKFAVATEANGQSVVVLRVTSSKVLPPTLPIAGAVGFKQYYKLPNLFIPMGTRLHPTMRRDAVRKLLADDPDRVVWLSPGVDGGFVPETLPEDAFRPLEDWVDYVIASNSVPLAAWVDATKFDFESFVCSETAKPKPDDGPGKGKKKSKGDVDTPLIPVELSVKVRTTESDTDDVGTQGFTATPEVRPPDEWIVRRKALEDEFLGTDGPLDSPARAALWPKLALATARAGAVDDAAICWVNAMWEQAPNRELADAWLRSELPDLATLDSPTEFDRLMVPSDPTPGELRQLSALVYRITFEKPVPAWFVTRLPAVKSYLDLHEGLAPLRAVWLTASRLAGLAGADTLGLARVRDRILLRLLDEGGLKTERDLPSFLKYDGVKDSERIRQVRDRALDLHTKVRRWAEVSLGKDDPSGTLGYIDLYFAFGLAKLGEVSTARGLVDSARRGLESFPSTSDRGISATFLLKAFRYRIDQALAGKPHSGPLDAALLDELDRIQTLANGELKTPWGDAAYAINRLREKSHILEPQEKLIAHAAFLSSRGILDKEIGELARIKEPALIARKIRDLYQNGVNGQTTSVETRFDVLVEALPRAARVGEAFTVELLNLVPEAMKATGSNKQSTLDFVRRQGRLLQQSLFLAAHFDRRDTVQRLVEEFIVLLKSKNEELRFELINVVAAQSLHSLRKLGMRDEIDKLLRRMLEVVLGGLTPAELRMKHRGKKPDPKAIKIDLWPKALQSLLNIAGGWLRIGMTEQAAPILADATEELLGPNALPLAPKDYTPLAQAYVSALGHGSADSGIARIADLFERMPVGRVANGWTTAKYYSLFHLNLVEDTVLAIVSDDFTLGPAGRRWLDEDEHLVRRRIHRDVKTALDRSGL